MAAGKTLWLLMGAKENRCMISVVTAQISNDFKITKTSQKLWDERIDQRVFVH
jgi:hypothetical protein